MNTTRGLGIFTLLLVGGAVLYWMMADAPEGATVPVRAVPASGTVLPVTMETPATNPVPDVITRHSTPNELAGAAFLAGGTVELVLVFPAVETELGQPILTTGFTGRGDGLYVECLPGGEVRFGWDHWGSQPIRSAPVELARETEHRVRVSLDRSIAGIEPMSAVLRVWLNGERVLKESVEVFPCAPDQVSFGENPTGMSTSQAIFFGQMLGVQVVPVSP